MCTMPTVATVPVTCEGPQTACNLYFMNFEEQIAAEHKREVSAGRFGSKAFVNCLQVEDCSGGLAYKQGWMTAGGGVR